MSSQREPTAVAVARAHVDAWGGHDYDGARDALAREVHVLVTSVDHRRAGDLVRLTGVMSRSGAGERSEVPGSPAITSGHSRASGCTRCTGRTGLVPPVRR
jgi:hypothetical protein